MKFNRIVYKTSALLIPLLLSHISPANAERLTNSLIVSIACSVQDAGVGMTGGKMRFSNDGTTWSEPEAFSTKKDLDLGMYGGSQEDGIKKIYAKFADSVGNWSTEPATLDVILDRKKPSITSYSPNVSTAVIGSRVTVSFSEPMDKESVESAFSISGGVAGNIVWDKNTLIFTPSVTFPLGREFRVTLAAGKDLAGNSLGKTSFMFSTRSTKRPSFLGSEGNISNTGNIYLSDQDPKFPPENINDENHQTYWLGSEGQSLVLAFDSDVSINRIKVLPYGKANGTLLFTRRWSLEYSRYSDPGTWYQFDRVVKVKGEGQLGEGISIERNDSNGSRSKVFEFIFPIKEVGALRFTAPVGAENSMVYLTELEIYENTGIPHQVLTMSESNQLAGFNLYNFFSTTEDSSFTYSVSQAEHIAVAINSNGTVVLTPKANWSGVESVKFKATDSYGKFISSNDVVLGVYVLPEVAGKKPEPVIDKFAIRSKNARFVRGKTVGISLIASIPDGGNISGYLIKESPEKPSPEDLVTTTPPRNYVLSDDTEDGEVSLYAWVISEEGVISRAANVVFILDSTAPYVELRPIF